MEQHDSSLWTPPGLDNHPRSYLIKSWKSSKDPSSHTLFKWWVLIKDFLHWKGLLEWFLLLDLVQVLSSVKRGFILLFKDGIPPRKKWPITMISKDMSSLSFGGGNCPVESVFASKCISPFSLKEDLFQSRIFS